MEQRYSTNLKTILAVFWISLYVFVNLASVLYLGSLALETIMGDPDEVCGVMGLGPCLPRPIPCMAASQRSRGRM